MNAKTVFAIISLILTVSPLISQSYNYQKLTVDDGLPSNSVNDLLIDRKGFLWIATDKGVSRYNGVEFENYSTIDGLSENQIVRMYEDSLNRIWLSPFNGKLCYWQEGKIINHLDDTALLVSHTSYIEEEFLEKKWSQLWIRHRKDGVVKYRESNSERIFSIAEFPEENLLIEEVGTSDITITSRSGKFIISDSGIDTVKLFPRDLYSPFTLLTDSFYIRKVDQAVVRYNKGLFESVFIPARNSTNSNTPKIYPSKLDGFWYKNNTPGTTLIQSSADSFVIRHFLNDIYINDIIDNKQGDIFFATDYGVYIVDNYESRVHSNENISAIEIDKDGILLGTHKGEVLKFSEGKISTIFKNKQRDKVQSILPAPEYLAGYKNGVYSMISERYLQGFSANFITRYNNSVFVGSSLGLLKLNKSLELQRTIDIDKPTCAYKSADRLWIGSNNGVYSYKDSIFEKYDGAHPYFSNSVSHLSSHKFFELLIGTNGNGLFFYSSRDSSIVIKMGNGLSDNSINHIYVDQDNIIWVCTGFGLNRIEFNKQRNFTVRKYFIENGLLSNNVSGVYREGDEIFITSDKGISSLDVHAKEVTLRPKIYLTRVRINGKVVPSKPFMELAHDNNDIEVEFKGVGLNSSTGIKYLYQLRSFNQTWFDIEIDARNPGRIEELKPIGSFTENWYETEYPKQRFPSLPPAFYVLRIKAIAYGGNESTEDAIFYFRIKKRFDQTLFFRISISLIFILFMTGIILFIRKSIRNREAAKTEINKKMAQLEMKALQARMNPHFIYNSLNAVNEFISENDPRSAHIYLSKFAQLIRKILEQSGRESISLQEELDTLKIYLELEKNRYREKFDYEIKVDERIDPYDEEIPSMIIQPFVENAIRHGLIHKKDKGTLVISFLSQLDSLKVIVEDNGIGRKGSMELKKDAKHKHKSLGLSLTEERLKVYNDAHASKKASVRLIDLHDESGSPKGTRVEIEFPNK